jgi:hypothetical protein
MLCALKGSFAGNQARVSDRSGYPQNPKGLGKPLVFGVAADSAALHTTRILCLRAIAQVGRATP